MSEDPPGNWELQRSLTKLSADLKGGIEGINKRLDSMVSTGVYASDQGRVDDRIKGIADDLTAEREQRIKSIEAEQRLREKEARDRQLQMDKLVITMRWVIAAVLVPVALFVTTIVLSQGNPP